MESLDVFFLIFIFLMANAVEQFLQYQMLFIFLLLKRLCSVPQLFALLGCWFLSLLGSVHRTLGVIQIVGKEAP